MISGKIGSRGTLTARKITPQRVGIGYKLRNAGNVWRGYWRNEVARLLGIPTLYATLHARLIRADGSVIDYGLVSTRVVTDEFVAHIVDALGGTTTRISDYDFHGIGTGTTAEAVTDVALVTPVETRATGTPSEPAANQYRSVGTITATAQRLVREHGLFSAASGTDELADRSVFALITLESGDSLQTTFTLTCSSGG